MQPDPLPNVASLPLNYTGEFGDAYLVGTAYPYNLFIWTRSNEAGVTGYWFNWGPMNAPSTVPGPKGDTGETGPAGQRGSFWYSQTGAPTITAGVLPNDQALDGSNGNVYQFVNGGWQLTGNIRGPQGIQGIQGLTGDIGPIGPRGEQGEKGDQGQFITILGTLANVNQLPSPTSVPRYAAYLVPVDGIESVYLIVGETDLQWHNAGSFGGGTPVWIDSAKQSSVDLTNVAENAFDYEIGENTSVTVNGASVSFNNLQAVGKNLNDSDIDTEATIELPIANSDDITFSVKNNSLQASLSESVKNDIQESISNIKPVEVQINAPTTATNGSLSVQQMNTLTTNPGAYLMFNNEIFRLQDTQHNQGYLVYTHIGFDNLSTIYKVKCITITLNSYGWVLTEQVISDAPTGNWMAYEMVDELPEIGDSNKIYLLVGVE